MQKLIIVYALLACSLAAPLEKSKETEELSKPVDLIRPSPINPDIPSDPKPEEKITLITDSKVLPLATTKPTKLPGPYVLPRELLLRTKREDKDSSKSSDENSSEEKKKPSRPLVASPASSIEKQSTKPSSKPVLSSSTHPSDEAHISGAVPSTKSVTIPAHPRIPYSPQIHQHNEHLFKPTTAAHSSGTSSTSSSTTARAVPSQDHVNDKRDIPVPLTRKFHHNDEEDDETKPKEEPSSPSSPSSTSSSTKVPKEEVKQEEEKDESHKAELVAASTTTNQQQHPATIARPIPVAELFAKKPSTE